MDKIIGLIVIVVVLSFDLIANSGGNILIFLDIPSLLSVIGLVIGSLVMTMGFDGVIHFTRTEDSKRKFFKVGKTSSIISGFLGALISFVIMFNFFSGDTKSLGLALAVCVLTLVYSCLSYFILFLWEYSSLKHD